MQSAALRYKRRFAQNIYKPDSSCVLYLEGQQDPQSSTIRDLSGKGNHGTIAGCLDGSSLVYTTQGAIPISKLRSGIDTFAYDNGLSVQKITGDIYSGYRQVYEVSTPTRSIKATDNHPFLTAVFNGQKKNSGYRNGHPYCHNDNDWSLQWLPLEDLQEGMAIVTAHHLPNNTVPYPSIDLMKLIGCILGDGYFGRDGIGLCLVKESEQQKYSQILDRLGIGHWVKDKEIKIYSKQLVSYFNKELGLEGNVYTKHLPSWVWGLPVSHKKALLEGLIDSDGWLIRRDGVEYGYGIELANERLIGEIKALCGYIGLRTSNILSRTREGHLLGDRQLPTSHTWSLQIYPNKGRNEQVRALTDGTRRRVNVPLSPEFQFETISSIKGIGERDTYDISVADNPNFIANGMVVHNSTWARLPSGLWVNSFDGTDDYINCGNAASLSITGSLSFSTWVKIDHLPGALDGEQMMVFGKGVWGEGGYILWITNFGPLRFLTAQPAGYTDSNSGTGLPVNKWCNIAISFTGTEVSYYIDGVFVVTRGGYTAPASGSRNFLIGIHTDLSNYKFEGLMAQPCLRNLTLSATEIANIFNSGRHLFGV